MCCFVEFNTLFRFKSLHKYGLFFSDMDLSSIENKSVDLPKLERL